MALAVMAEGDITRGGFLEILGDLLDHGVQVALMYGDRDYIGNWISGERSSLAINSTLSRGFKNAGYANITTNETYTGGVVRQYGNLSFSRIFDAAHGGSSLTLPHSFSCVLPIINTSKVPYYQPQTAYKIFHRATFHKDISSGLVPLLSTLTPYSSKGPDSSSGFKNTMPVDPKKVCYTYSAYNTCTEEQMERLGNGTAIVRDWVVVGYEEGSGSVYY
jgi:hypothetical protein